MEIFSTRMFQYVIIDSSIGEFKLLKNGHLLRWSRADKDYVEFDRERFSLDDLYEISRSGNEMLYGVVGRYCAKPNCDSAV